jgi:hypothetical protein
MNTLHTRFAKSLALLFVIVGLGLTGCKKDEAPPPTGTPTGSPSLTGQITFTYNGQPMTAAQWPFSNDPTLAFPSGYVRIALTECDASGRATVPKGVIGSGTGIAFAELVNGAYTFKFEGDGVVEAGKYYLINPTYVNIRGRRGGPGGDVQIGIGNYGAQTVHGYGSGILATATGNTNLTIVSDLKIGEFSYNATANSARDSSVTFMGSVTVDNAALWPSGNPFTPGLTPAQVQQQEYLALTAYKGTNTPGPGVPPDVFVLIQKPASGNVGVFNANRGMAGLYKDGDYHDISIDLFRGYAKKNPTAPPMATMRTAAGSGTISLRFNQTYMMNWQPTVSMPTN